MRLFIGRCRGYVTSLGSLNWTFLALFKILSVAPTFRVNYFCGSGLALCRSLFSSKWEVVKWRPAARCRFDTWKDWVVSIERQKRQPNRHYDDCQPEPITKSVGFKVQNLMEMVPRACETFRAYSLRTFLAWQKPLPGVEQKVRWNPMARTPSVELPCHQRFINGRSRTGGGRQAIELKLRKKHIWIICWRY